MTVFCPFCRARLEAEQHANVEVDRCTACAALWFDKNELRAYVTAKRGAEPQFRNVLPFSNGTLLPCPRCKTDSLYRCRVAGVQARHCPTCGGIAMEASPLSRATKEDLRGAAETAVDALSLAPDLALHGGEAAIEAVLDFLAGALDVVP
jgi:Zn-finger nucleic acid-binding protein